MTRAAAALTALLLANDLPARGQTVTAGCGPQQRVPGARDVVRVRTVDELERSVARARPHQTIELAPGTYALSRTLSLATRGVTLRGATQDPTDVTLHGGGMVGDNVGVAIAVAAEDVTIAGITVRDVAYHAVQVRGESGASGFTLHHARLLDTGQQLLKVSAANNGKAADDGVVACSELSYTHHAPSNYTNGIDILAAKGWSVRGNRLLRIRGPQSDRWRAGPAVLAWAASEDTVVEGNLVIDSFRGIALGLAAGSSTVARGGERGYDHRGGAIRNNVIVNLNEWADEAIEANAARDVRIEHNTVMVTGSVPWSIGVRFPTASASVRNNLTNRPLLRRDGGVAEVSGDIDAAQPEWFLDASNGNMHLAAPGRAAIGAGTTDTTTSVDFDGKPRALAPTVGAFEFGPATPDAATDRR